MKLSATVILLIISQVASGKIVFTAENRFLPDIPSTQASNITFSQVQPTSLTVNWSNGDGAKRVVFIKEGNTGEADPVNNDTYLPGMKTPGGWKCVYNGTGASETISDLVPGIDYTIHICEYNGSSGIETYLNSSVNGNPTSFNTIFSEESILLPGLSNGFVSWGDYNNDNFLDLFMSCWGRFSKIYKNNGNNTYSEQTAIALESSGWEAAWADYDGNGYLDLLMSGSSPLSYVYHNNGDNTFSKLTGIALDQVLQGTCSWGDYDGDGDIDILISGSSLGGSLGRICKIYKNMGANIFTEQTGISLPGVYAGSTDWVDYDNDGDLDILITGIGSIQNSELYSNNGEGIYTLVKTVSFPEARDGSSAWSDYNQDGKLDLLITGSSWAGIFSKIYRNNGNDSFTEQTGICLTGVKNSSVAWGDYNNDGLPDILLAGNSDSGPVTKIYRNNGDNTFSEQTTCLLPALSYCSVAWGDYDNDNDLDIIMSGKDSRGIEISKIFRNNSTDANQLPAKPLNLVYEVTGKDALIRWDKVTTDETSQNSISYNIRVGKSSLGDDVVSSNSAPAGFRHIAVSGNNQLSTEYRLKKLRWNTNYYASVQAVDNSFKGGAFSDEIIINYPSEQITALSARRIDHNSLMLKWKRGNGDRCIVFAREGDSGTAIPTNMTTYYANQVFGEGSPLNTVWFCVYKGEADSIMVAGLDPLKNYKFQVMELQGTSGNEVYLTSDSDNAGLFNTSSFAELTGVSLPGVDHGVVLWADFNNDGHLDFLLSGSWSYVAKIYANNKDNTFLEQTSTPLTGLYASSAAVGDYDNDNDLDILITGSPSYGNRISKVYRNEGGFNFTYQTSIILTAVDNGSVSWVDYDNDNDLDIMITGATGDYPNENPVSKIYRNDNGSFSDAGIELPGIYERSPAVWGDYNNDGYVDLLLSGYPYIAKLYKNVGDGTFSVNDEISLTSADLGNTEWGDCNKDGYLDILSFGWVSDIYSNEGTEAFTKQSIMLQQVVYGTAHWLDFNNDGYQDIIMSGRDFPSNKENTRVFRNDRSGNFVEQEDIKLSGVSSPSLAMADYDNDGDIDILLCGASGGAPITKLYRNNLFMKPGTIHDNKIPDQPSGLTSNLFPGYVRLSWSPVKTDETVFPTMSYNIRYRQKNATSWKGGSASAENGYRKIPAIGNAQLNNFFILRNLASGEYEWQVQAIDQAYAGGAWSETNTFEIKNVQTFFSANEVCLGLPTQFTDESTASKGIALWQWDFGDGTISTLQNPQHIYATSGTFGVKLTITDTESSTDFLIKSISVKAKPSVNFSAPVVCQGTSTSFSNSTNNNGLTISSWFWDFGDGQTSIIQNPSPHGYLGAADYTVLLKAQADNGCIDEKSKTVTVAGNPVAAISADAATTFCSGQSVTLSTLSNTLYSYSWIRDGAAITGAISNSYIAFVSGSYSVVVTNTVANCSTNSSAVNVTANTSPASPYITAAGPLTFCQGESVDLSVAITSGYSYQWKLNGGAVGTGSNAYTANASGTYSLEVANASGCKSNSTNSVDVIVNSIPVVPTVNISGSTSFCQGGSIDLSVSSSAGYAYQWENNGAAISGASANKLTVNTSGVYALKITNTDNCFTKSDNIIVSVLTAPSTPTIFAGSSTTFCQDDSVMLSVNSVSGSIYDWKLNGGTVSTAGNSFAARSSGDYTVVVSNSSGCSVNSVNKITANVIPKPSSRTISTSGATTFCQGSSVTLSVSPETGCSYFWRNENGLLPGAVSTSYVARTSGAYRLDISNASGCSITTSPVNVLVKQSPQKPVLENSNYVKGQCPGENPVRLSTTQVTGYKYQWSKNEQVQAYDTLPFIQFYEAGNYKLTAELNGCSAESDLFSAEFPAGPVKPVIYAEGPTYWYLACNNTEANAYKWYFNGKLIENATKYYFTANQKLGVYQVSIGDKNGCFTKSDPVTIPPGFSGLEETDPFSGLKIYPNPTPGLFTVEMDNNIMGELSIDIFSQAGNKVLNIEFEKTTEHFKSQVDLSGQSKGMYAINFMLKKYFATRKVMVE